MTAVREDAAVRWGFLGAGSIAQSSLAPAVHAAGNAVLQAAASRDLRRAAATGAAYVYGSYDELLGDEHVDAVYIALHNSAHREWTLKALRAGKHVLCEKPLGLTGAEAAEMTMEADRVDRLLVEAVWNRWHPRTRQLEALTAAGALGQIHNVIARFDGSAPGPENYRSRPDLGGGALLDVGCYAIAAVLSAYGWRTPDATTVFHLQRNRAGADTECDLVLDFPEGGTAEIHSSLSRGSAETLTLYGDHGVLEVSDPAFTAGAAACSMRVSGSRVPVVYEYVAVDPYRLMVENVSDAVRGRPAYVVPASQSLAVARVTDAAFQAMPLSGGLTSDLTAGRSV